MSDEKKEVLAAGEFFYDCDSKRFHRFKFEAEGGVVGVLYVPKKCEAIPTKIILDSTTR